MITFILKTTMQNVHGRFYFIEAIKTTQNTWGSCDVHGFQVPGFDDRDSQSARSRKIAEWKHQVTQVNIILQYNHNTHKYTQQLTTSNVSIMVQSIWEHPLSMRMISSAL